MTEIIKIDYAELAGANREQSKTFFAAAFGWTFTDYGPEYFSFDNAGLDGGMGAPEDGEIGSLIVLKTDDLEEALERVKAAGGEIVREIFSFPGGRRFHFKEPSGNEMAIWSL